MLSHRADRSQTLFDRILFASLLQWSLIAAFAGILPGVLGALKDPPDDIWRVSLGVLVFIHGGSAIWTLQHIRSLDFTAMQRLESRVVIWGFPTGLTILLAQAAAFAGYLPELQFAYMASVAYFLFLSALAFSFSLIIGFREKK